MEGDLEKVQPPNLSLAFDVEPGEAPLFNQSTLSFSRNPSVLTHVKPLSSEIQDHCTLLVS